MTVPKVYRIALSDLLAHGYVLCCHQDGALVDIAPDRVAVAAVVNQRQAGVHSCSNPFQLELVCQFVNLMMVVATGTDNLRNKLNIDDFWGASCKICK